jgi:DNA-binding response OmpR family regulator
MAKTRILVVDDDPEILELLTIQLEFLDYQVLTSPDGTDALIKFNKYQPDLVILDINLPAINGIEVCRKLRGLSNVPIIMLSGRTDYYDKALCLELGADDYITKPFNTIEFAARIGAVLRRFQRASLETNMSKVVAYKTLKGELLIDLVARRVTLAGKEVSLTETEFKLLWELVSNAGKVMTYSELLANVWGKEYKEATNYLHNYIRLLRAKIELDPDNPQNIINIPRVGYRFDCVK